MNLATWLQRTANSHPDRIAIYEGINRYATYAELLKQTQHFAGGLRQLGIKPGDNVAVYAPNCPQYLMYFYAIWQLGAVIVPINYKLHPNEVTWILDNANAQLLISDKAIDTTFPAEKTLLFNSKDYQALLHAPPVKQPHVLKDDATAWLFYTSGTTGRPKGAMLSHHNLAAMVYGYCVDVDAANPDYHKLYAAPISHGAGLYHLIFIRCGASHLIPKSQRFDPAEIKQLAEHFGNLVMFAAPTMIKRLIAFAQKIGWQGEGIQTLIYGGGPMYLADINTAIKQFGHRFVQIYGQGESPMTISTLTRAQLADTSSPNWQQRRSSVGQATAGITLKIIDEQQQTLAAQQPGEICVKGDSVMQGYFNQPTATAETLTADGWLKTGDLGYLDDAGFLYLTDRIKDVIISGGSNIYPREVEEVLLHHDSVKEVAVIGKPDDDWGEIVVAYVVLHDKTEADENTLETWCKRHMASFKKPKVYYFLQSLPKNSYGKILKTELRNHN